MIARDRILLCLLWIAALARPASADLQSSIAQSYGKLPLRFEPNQGQTDPQVDFVARGAGYALFVTRVAAVLALRDRQDARRPDEVEHPTWTALRMEWVGANPRSRVVGLEPLPGASHYLTSGDPASWRTQIRGFARAQLEAIYPGVDLIYYGDQGRLEYDLVVAPDADARSIRLRFAGALGMEILADGDLVVRTAGGEVRFKKPVLYQDRGGTRENVAGAYVRRGEREIGFSAGTYDRSRALVIDPVLIYSTYLGGGASEMALGVALGTGGEAYVTGTTRSADFPVDAGALDADGIGRSEAFVAKLDAAGSALVYSTHLGGSGFDSGTRIAVDGAGDAYVVGNTDSRDFPTTARALAPAYGGGITDAFVAKLDPSGSALIYSTYLGGRSFDVASGLAVDAAGAVYVSGSTGSVDFPVTAGCVDSSLLGSGDAFVAKLDSSGAALVYATYLGGSGNEIASSIAVDGLGAAYVGGTTFSADFPISASAFDRTFNADPKASDAFAAKLDPWGASLLYSTYLGGSRADTASSIAVDSAGHAYLAGETRSSDFPATAGAFDTALGGDPAPGGDGFVAELDPSGSALVYATYLGGASADSISSIAVDPGGLLTATGITASLDFPTSAETLDRALSGASDAFVARFAPGGAELIYSTYLGGMGEDGANDLAVDASGAVYVAGNTSSADFPIVSGAASPALHGTEGAGDGFVAKLAIPRGPVIVPTQFIAKLFTEAYGRLPEPAEWAAEYRFFDAEGQCTPANLKARGRRFYLSREFFDLHYGNAERLLAAHRGIANQNPSQRDLDVQRRALDLALMSWSELVDALFDSSFFAALAPAICKNSGRDPANYYFGIVPHPTLPVPSGDAGFPGGSGRSLQLLLDAAPAGSTTFLAQDSLTVLTEPLTIPPGKALATTGFPSVAHYAKQARLVMSEPPFVNGIAMIVLQPGAVLRNVFIDGNLGNPSRMTAHGPFAVALLGGTGTALLDSKLAASRSNNTVGLASSNGGYDCGQVFVTGNLLTGYGGQHYPAPNGTHYEQLGVEAGCGAALVAGNSFVDLTDNSLSAYSVLGGVQASEFTDNRILQAGNSAYSAISLDSIVADTQPRAHRWRGFVARSNRMAGNARVHTDTLISIGAGEFYDRSRFPALGFGAQILDNEVVSDPTLESRVNVLVSTQGMLAVTEQGTRGEAWVAPTGVACASGARLAALSVGRASGILGGPYRDVVLNSCMWH